MTKVLKTSATDFKQHVGKYLDESRRRPVLIERHGRPTAVLLSVEEYELLDPSALDVIDMLTDEFDELVARMQEREVQKGLDKAFGASQEQLGAAHQRGMKGRRGG